jgi:hypothetical protein
MKVIEYIYRDALRSLLNGLYELGPVNKKAAIIVLLVYKSILTACDVSNSIKRGPCAIFLGLYISSYTP